MEFTQLEVWQESRKLANLSYGLTKSFPKEECFGLTHQIRKSAISVPSNIAEGCGRNSTKDTLQFLYISRGSIYELETQFYIAFDQNFITELQFKNTIHQIIICKKLINGFINYYKKLQNEQR